MKGLKFYFKKAEKEKWAIGQFNFSNLEILKAIIEAGRKLKSPLILGTSEGESKFLGLKIVGTLLRTFKKEEKLPLFLNFDHGHFFDNIKRAIEAGYDAIHFDGSRLSLRENIELTKKIVKYAHRKGIWVEGEVGVIGEVGGLKSRFTQVKEVVYFLKETKVDSLAVAIGNLHGMEKGRTNPHLNLKRLEEIKKGVGKTPLVLHGGSGTKKEDIIKAIKSGIVKINVNTELRKVYTETLKKALKEKPREIIPYHYLPEVIKVVQKVVEEKIKLFGSNIK